MKRKWLVALGTLNILAILFAIAQMLTDFAILAPTRLKYELGDLQSIRGAIFQAESGGIELMRGCALLAVGVLAVVMLTNFASLWFVSQNKNKNA